MVATLIRDQTKKQKRIQLPNGLSINMEDAKRALRQVSKSTFYRWAKEGIDNQYAEQLLVLFSEHRVMPRTKDWQGWKFNHEGELCCDRYPQRKGMGPYQLEQTLFLQNMFLDQCEVMEQIRNALTAIEPRSDKPALDDSQEGPGNDRGITYSRNN